jgi:tetratricopeptide (TPR) repeat protein
VGHSRRLAYLGETYLLAGRTDDAIEVAGRALDLSLRLKEQGYQSYARRLLGEVAAHRDPPDAETAEGHYRQAMTLAGELGMRPLVAHCHLGLGTLYSKIGRREEACAELSKAIGLYRSMDMTFWLPRAEVELAQVSG